MTPRTALPKMAAALGSVFAAVALTTPVAHADDTAIRAGVDFARTTSPCPALEYREDLRMAAYGYARGGGEPPTNGYPGSVVGFKGEGDPAEAATRHAVVAAWDAIKDCRYTGFGVSMLRVDIRNGGNNDIVAIVLGKPAMKLPDLGGLAGVTGGGKKPDGSQVAITCAACQVNPQVQSGPTATVTSDVDVYDEPGGTGTVVGILRKGDVVAVTKPCPAADWCALSDGRFAWGEFLTND